MWEVVKNIEEKDAVHFTEICESRVQGAHIGDVALHGIDARCFQPSDRIRLAFDRQAFDSPTESGGRLDIGIHGQIRDGARTKTARPVNERPHMRDSGSDTR